MAASQFKLRPASADPKLMRFRALTTAFALLASTIALWTVGASAGYASLFATTGTATSITSTSATLNGVALTLNPSSAWSFQYGTTTAYGEASRSASIGLGLTSVSTTVTGLRPSTTYHFRLVVLQGSPADASDYSAGDDVTLTTPAAAAAASAYGHTSLQTHALRVRRGATSLEFGCAGSNRQVCKGKLALVLRRADGTLVGCSSAKLSAAGGHRRTLRTELSGACRALLRKTPTHSLTGAVLVSLNGAQKLLTSLVTLADSVAGHDPTAVVAAAHGPA